MKSSFLAFIVAGAVLGVVSARGADHAPPALERELQQLRSELAAARGEIARLRAENARLRGDPKAAGASATVVDRSALRSPPAVALPELTLAEAVSVDQLIERYQVDRWQAERQFRDKTFQIKGVIDRIDPPWVGMTYEVILRGSDPFTRVKCQVRFPGISDLTLAPDKQTLSGAKPFKKSNRLLGVGDTVILEGTCEGLKDTVVIFKNARPATGGPGQEKR